MTSQTPKEAAETKKRRWLELVVGQEEILKTEASFERRKESHFVGRTCPKAWSRTVREIPFPLHSSKEGERKNQGNVKENGKKKKEEERGEDVGSFSRSHEERNARVYERDACFSTDLAVGGGGGGGGGLMVL